MPNLMIIKAKPNTELRDYAICALADEGFVGPNYSLDDISATVSIIDDTIYISFWDMDRYIRTKNKYHRKLKELIKNYDETNTTPQKTLDELYSIPKKTSYTFDEVVDLVKNNLQKQVSQRDIIERLRANVANIHQEYLETHNPTSSADDKLLNRLSEQMRLLNELKNSCGT